MSIQSEITRINENVSAAYDQVEAKGGTLPVEKSSANLADAIATIQGGDGVDFSLPVQAISSYDQPIVIKNTLLDGRCSGDTLPTLKRFIGARLVDQDSFSTAEKISSIKCPNLEEIYSYSWRGSASYPSFSTYPLEAPKLRTVRNSSNTQTRLCSYTVSNERNILLPELVYMQGVALPEIRKSGSNDVTVIYPKLRVVAHNALCASHSSSYQYTIYSYSYSIDTYKFPELNVMDTRYVPPSTNLIAPFALIRGDSTTLSQTKLDCALLEGSISSAPNLTTLILRAPNVKGFTFTLPTSFWSKEGFFLYVPESVYDVYTAKFPDYTNQIRKIEEFPEICALDDDFKDNYTYDYEYPDPTSYGSYYGTAYTWEDIKTLCDAKQKGLISRIPLWYGEYYRSPYIQIFASPTSTSGLTRAQLIGIDLDGKNTFTFTLPGYLPNGNNLQEWELRQYNEGLVNAVTPVVKQTLVDGTIETQEFEFWRPSFEEIGDILTYYDKGEFSVNNSYKDPYFFHYSDTNYALNTRNEAACYLFGPYTQGRLLTNSTSTRNHNFAFVIGPTEE